MKLWMFLTLSLVVQSAPAQLTYERLLHAGQEPQNWLTYSGSYASNRYSKLTQINRDNVKNLQVRWVCLPNWSEDSKMENTPLVVDGIVYTGTMTEVVALDAVTGKQYWKVARSFNPSDYVGQHVY